MSFLQQAIVSTSGMGRDVHSLMLSSQHFLCWLRHHSPSKVPWRTKLMYVWQTNRQTKEQTLRQTTTTTKTRENHYLSKTEWYKGHVVCWEHGVKEDLLHAIVEICLKHLHFLTNYIRSQGTAVKQDRVLVCAKSQGCCYRCCILGAGISCVASMLAVPFNTSNRPWPGMEACVQRLDCEAKEDQVGS